MSTPADLSHFIVITRSLSKKCQTYTSTIQLHPKKVRRDWVKGKNYKIKIQLLCANPDPLGSIVRTCPFRGTRNCIIRFLPLPSCGSPSQGRVEFRNSVACFATETHNIRIFRYSTSQFGKSGKASDLHVSSIGQPHYT